MPLKTLDYYMLLNYDVKLEKISDEDGGGWLARIEELEGCIADGETPNEAIDNIEDAKKDWIEFCLENEMTIPEPTKQILDGYSGRFTLRVGKSTHRQLTEISNREGLSVNSVVNKYIVMGLQNTYITEELKEIIENKLQPNINVSINHDGKRLHRKTHSFRQPLDIWERRAGSIHFNDELKGVEHI